MGTCVWNSAAVLMASDGKSSKIFLAMVFLAAGLGLWRANVGCTRLWSDMVSIGQHPAVNSSVQNPGSIWCLSAFLLLAWPGYEIICIFISMAGMFARLNGGLLRYHAPNVQ